METTTAIQTNHPGIEATSVSKKMLWLGRILSAIPVLMLLMSAAMKFVKPAQVVQGFAHLGLAIGCAPAFKPSPDGCSAALEVEEFDAAIAHLKKHDVKFRIEPLSTPVCRMAMIFDPDGNTICIHKRNPGR